MVVPEKEWGGGAISNSANLSCFRMISPQGRLGEVAVSESHSLLLDVDARSADLLKYSWDCTFLEPPTLRHAKTLR